MKAAVTTGRKREVAVEEVPTPEVQPGTLRLKTAYCSICGTDLEYLDNTLAYRLPLHQETVSVYDPDLSGGGSLPSPLSPKGARG